MTIDESITENNNAAFFQQMEQRHKDLKAQSTYHRNMVVTFMLDGNETKAAEHANCILDRESHLLALQSKILDKKRELVAEMRRRVAR